ncbi:MAG: 50S ribosomal protein L17 [Prevotellaceae bacterium]|jgi:large subunit ribosomal protein L17|nr:50S ribosomal protein L17 [Prevotellaceae bacterium]
MRHRKSFNHLGRKSQHRKAMLANMASSLIIHKRIETTEAKAKALREYVEPLITKSKEDTTHSRRMVFSYLKTKEAVTELFRVVAPKVADRPGGYTRVLKIGFRLGDSADMAMIELVDFNEAALAASSKKDEKKSVRRSRPKKSNEPKAQVADKKAPAKKATEKAKPTAEEPEVVIEPEVADEIEDVEVPEVEVDVEAEEEVKVEEEQ